MQNFIQKDWINFFSRFRMDVLDKRRQNSREEDDRIPDRIIAEYRGLQHIDKRILGRRGDDSSLNNDWS